jgi:predicted nuclease with RNAse H fold/GNAT superfamily N-acetyltransferase
MLPAVARWIGVDVGGKSKGFDVALIDDHRVLALEGGLTRDAVVEFVQANRPAVVAIDSPRCCAPDGQSTRDGERQVNASICHIRWTPDAKRVHARPYYAWIVEGLDLFDALAERGVDAIEVFPTASWTRWHGERGSRRRADWSREALGRLGLDGVPLHTNQDQRDAIAAAVTAREYTHGTTETMGEIVVPAAPLAASVSPKTHADDPLGGTETSHPVRFVDLDPGDPRIATDLLPVLKELRPHVTADTFAAVYAEGHPQGLRFTAAYGADDCCIAVAGWRFVATTVALRKLYVDDLVTASDHRGRGVGAALLSELERRARAARCSVLDLDSGTDRGDAHRFYFREEMVIRGFHFLRRLR